MNEQNIKKALNSIYGTGMITKSLSEILLENFKIYNNCHKSLESETVMIGKIKIKGREYYDRLSKRPGNV